MFVPSSQRRNKYIEPGGCIARLIKAFFGRGEPPGSTNIEPGGCIARLIKARPAQAVRSSCAAAGRSLAAEAALASGLPVRSLAGPPFECSARSSQSFHLRVIMNHLRF